MEKERIKMNIRKLIAGVVCLAAASGFLTGCGSASSTAQTKKKKSLSGRGMRHSISKQ